MNKIFFLISALLLVNTTNVLAAQNQNCNTYGPPAPGCNARNSRANETAVSNVLLNKWAEDYKGDRNHIHIYCSTVVARYGYQKAVKACYIRVLEVKF